nr:MAG TPA: hypothetical protein [Caudoviricetes sp.]
MRVMEYPKSVAVRGYDHSYLVRIQILLLQVW